MSSGRLVEEVGGLLERALTEAPPSPRERLAEARSRLDEPLRVAIAGRVKAGKSTLLNALVGEEVAPTDAGECTQVVTWYRNAHTYRVLLHGRDGEARQRPFTRADGALQVDLDVPAEEVDHLEVWWPSRRLEDMTLIDTPGIASLSADVSQRSHDFLGADEDRPARADAVLYLMRHLHAGDSRFLEAFHQGDMAQRTPVNSLAVLSRADEIGSCRLDAMDDATRVAARYQGDAAVRRLCFTVVPVAGLLGQGGATLHESEFRALTALAGAPATEAAGLLLTADRFGRAPSPIPVPEAERQLLLARLGLFGVRLSERLIRSGQVSTAGSLAAELVRVSGLDRLRAVLASQFGTRSRVLKARSALVALGTVLRSMPGPAANQLRADVERVTAGAHELGEVILINRLSRGDVDAPADRLDEMLRLLGVLGDDAAVRLGLPDDAGPDALRAAAAEAHQRWQRTAEHPLSSQAYRAAARTIVRSCEGILSRLASPAAGG